MNSKEELLEFNKNLLLMPRDGLKILNLVHRFQVPDNTLLPQEWGYINIKSKIKQWQNYYLNMSSVGACNKDLQEGKDGYFTFHNNDKAQGKKHCLLDCTIKGNVMYINTRASEPMSRLPMDFMMIRDYILPFLKRDITAIEINFGCISFLPNYVWVLVNLGLDPNCLPPKIFGSAWNLLLSEARNIQPDGSEGETGLTENRYHSYQRQLMNFMRSPWFVSRYGKKDLMTPDGLRKWESKMNAFEGE